MELAGRHGFEGYHFGIGEAAALGVEKVKEISARTGVRPSAWGFPVNFRGSQEDCERDMEKLSELVVVPECFSLLTLDSDQGVRIVQGDDVPTDTPILCSPSATFFHETLVDHLLSSGAQVQNPQRVRLFREATGFSSGQYFTLVIESRWPFQDMLSGDFRPAMVNLVDEIGVVFFSHEYALRLRADTGLPLKEAPIIHLVPIGYEP
jgi:hypothetical protein